MWRKLYCDVGPIATSINSANLLAYNPIFLSDNTVESTFNPFMFDCFSLFFGKFLGHITTLSTFFNHIYRIINFCTRKQMGRINAERIITSMQYTKTFGDRSISQYPCHSMSLSLTFFISKRAITSPYASSPIPTIIRFGLLCFIPKTTSKRTKQLSRVKALKRNIASLAKYEFFKHTIYVPQTA